MLCPQLPIWRAVSMLARLRRSASWFSSTRRGAGRPERVSWGGMCRSMNHSAALAVFIDHCVVPRPRSRHTTHVKRKATSPVYVDLYPLCALPKRNWHVSNVFVMLCIRRLDAGKYGSATTSAVPLLRKLLSWNPVGLSALAPRPRAIQPIRAAPEPRAAPRERMRACRPSTFQPCQTRTLSHHTQPNSVYTVCRHHRSSPCT